MKNISLILFIIISLFSAVLIAQTDAEKSNITFNYSIKPIPTDVGMDFDVNLSFKSDSIVTFKVPIDYYGTKDYQQYFRDFKGKRKTIIENGKEAYQKKVTPNENGQIDISYTLSLSQKEMDKISFAPNISSSHFYLAGSQWILPIGPMDKPNEYFIKMIDYPKGWNFYSSLSKSPLDMGFNVTYEGLMSSGFGGGNQKYKTFYIKEKPVSVFVQGEYDIPTDSIIEAVGKIVKFQRDWFQDYDQPYYTVSINSRSNNLAVTSFPNLFVCFVMPEASKLQLFKLLSHEMFHRWLPNKLNIKTNERESSLIYAWFYEGFTDYFSRKILLEAGIMTELDFIESINNDLFLIANNVSANDTYRELEKRQEDRRFSGEQKKLYYYKGSLMALKWETEIKQKNPNSSLKQFLLELIDYGKISNDEISFQYLLEKGNGYGLNIKSDFEEFIINGNDVKLNQESFSPNFKLKVKKIPSFDKGFEVDYGEELIIKKVDPALNAHKIGLRNGMQFLSSKNAYLFGNAWMPGKPVKVNVMIDGKVKIFEYYPEGKPIKVPQFVKQ